MLQVAFGQLKYGTYEISDETIEVFGSRNFSRLIINSDNTFTYKYLTSLSCLLWYDSRGNWEAEDGYLILTDSIYSYHPVIDFVVEQYKGDNKVSILVITKDEKPIESIRIDYIFKNSADTLVGYTNSQGKLIISTTGIAPQIQTGDFISIDDIEIWVVYSDPKGRDQTTNTLCTLSADIKCVIDNNAVDEKMLRTTKYKIRGSDLTYDSQTFSKEDPRPGGYLYGNFRFEKE